MESFTGFENRFKYSIGGMSCGATPQRTSLVPLTMSLSRAGHSGDSPNIPLVDTVKQPQNRRQRMAVLRRMAAHSQFCSYAASIRLSATCTSPLAAA
jgi:hypothetical protein